MTDLADADRTAPNAAHNAVTNAAPRWRRTLVVVAACLAAALTARLGVWQLDRAEHKRSLQAIIEQRRSLPPLPMAELPRDAASAAQQHYRRIELSGTWLSQHTVYLDNRQMNARPGFFVVTPLLLAPGDAVLVQRGWLPRHSQDRTELPPLQTLEGELHLAGRIAPPPSKLYEPGTAVATGLIRQNLDMDDFSREIGVALRPLSVQQLEAESDVSASATASARPPATRTGSTSANVNLARQWLNPAADTAKHHGYAFQWFALCALIVGLTAWFQLVRPGARAQPLTPKT